jgi:hypothetical protein
MKRFPVPATARMFAERGGSDLREWAITKPKLTVKWLCRPCNNGWMSNLESRAKPVIESILDDRLTSLDAAAQALLATWAVKTAMVLEAFDPAQPWFYSAEERGQMRLSRSIPRRTSVWMAKCVNQPNIYSAATHHRTEPGPNGAHAFAVTLAFGPLALQVMTIRTTTPLPEHLTVTYDVSEGPWDQLLLQLWPTREGPATWPLAYGLDGDLGLQALTERFGGLPRRDGRLQTSAAKHQELDATPARRTGNAGRRGTAGQPPPQEARDPTGALQDVSTMANPDRQIYTDPDINAYQGYMPDDWGEKVIGPIPEGTVLERLLLDLAVSWRSASYTAQMPATSIRAMHAAALGRSKFVSPDSSIVGYSDAILAQLSRRVPELVENRRLRSTLCEELVRIAAEFRDRAAAAKKDYPVEPIWAEFMNDVAFRISLWASQRVAYVAFYNAYEAFLVDCLKVGTGRSQLRSTDKKVFNEVLRTGLSTDISGPCWHQHEINIARLVRHALSHNGGRETEDLKKHKHGVMVIGEQLQILPEDNHRMLRRLRSAVEEVIAVTASDSKFQAAASKLPQPREDEE